MQELQSRMQNSVRRVGKATMLLPVFLLFLLGFLSLAQGQIMTLQAAGEAEISSLVDAANDAFLPIIYGGGDSPGKGIVYRDYNADGARNKNEPGVPGITVSAYTADGKKAADAITNDQGVYRLSIPGGVQYRLEVTGIPEYLQPGVVGIDSKATVAFATTPFNHINFGLNNPADYCQDNPELGTPCYLFGDQSLDLPALVSFHNRAGSTEVDPNFKPVDPNPYDDANNDVLGVQTHPVLAKANKIGTTNGLAFQGSTNVLFAGAFMKRHSGFGPGGTGAIYRIDRANNNSVSLYADLNALFGANTAGENPHDSSQSTTDPFDFFLHDPSFDDVGKISLGDIEISEDEKYLYTVNLADKMLYRIPVLNNALPTKDVINRFPLPAPSNCAPTDIRPFALAVQDGTLYAGMVCSAQSTQNKTDLRAYVYSFDGNSFSGPVIDFRLDYPRQCADRNPKNKEPGCNWHSYNEDADWNPWVGKIGETKGTFGQLLEYSGTAELTDKTRTVIYPQPLLTDIEFANGYMILGLRDRNGDLLGNGGKDPREYGENGTPVGFPDAYSTKFKLYKTISAGDILVAAPDGNGWKLESNAVVGNRSSKGDGNGDGPGGGEFFFQDSFAVVTDNYPRHAEVSQGGLSIIAGQGDALTTAFNPIPTDNAAFYYDGGIIWLSGQDGTRSRSYRIFAGDAPPSGTPDDPIVLAQGKNNGLGDLEVFCYQAPLEIGDRVWLDTNRDGIQDPGEPPLPGVSVRLYAPDMTLLAEAKTNADGNYYFSNATSGPLSGSFAIYGVEGLKPNTTGYKLRIDMNQAIIAFGNREITKVDADGHTDNDNKLDLRDSDAIASGTDAEIMFDTGGAGHNNHTLDFGFVGETPDPLLSITKKTNGQDAKKPVEPGVPQIKPGDPVTWTYEVTNTGDVPFAKKNVVVTDSRGVKPVFYRVVAGNEDDILQPGEVWEYKAEGIAENVGLPIPQDGVPTLWGINEDVNGLFSIDDYREIGQKPIPDSYTNHGQLYYDLDGVDTLIPRDIGSIAIRYNNVAFMAYNKDLDPGGGQETLAAPVLLSLDLDDLPGTGKNVVTVIGSIPIPGFDPGSAVDDNISGMSFDPLDPEDVRLYALYRVTDGPTTDKLVAIDKNTAAVIGIGEMKNDDLGLFVEDGEALEFDEFGNLYVSDNYDDHLYKVDPDTAEIIGLVDNDQKGGLNVNKLKTEGLAWDPIEDTMVASDDNHDLFYIQTFENGNNASLGRVDVLTDVEAIDFIISTCYKNIGTASATATYGGKSYTVSASDQSHYCN